MCDTCILERQKGCQWCNDLDNGVGGKGLCLHNNDTRAATCKQERCSDVCAATTKCGECNAITGCNWCMANETALCVNTGLHVNNCTALAECAAPGDGKTGMFFLGCVLLTPRCASRSRWSNSMFIMVLIIGIAVGAFVFYRKRSGRPVYTSI